MRESNVDLAQTIGLAETATPQHIILIRLLVAAALGAVIGFEREHTARVAGLRTHILVSTAAALFTVLTFEIFQRADVGATRADPIRAVEAVTAGGGVPRRGGHLPAARLGARADHGAGMWLAGAVGICAALGFYVIGAAVALFAVLVLALLRRFAHGVVRHAEQQSAGRERDPAAP